MYLQKLQCSVCWLDLLPKLRRTLNVTSVLDAHWGKPMSCVATPQTIGILLSGAMWTNWNVVKAPRFGHLTKRHVCMYVCMYGMYVCIYVPFFEGIMVGYTTSTRANPGWINGHCTLILLRKWQVWRKTLNAERKNWDCSTIMFDRTLIHLLQLPVRSWKNMVG